MGGRVHVDGIGEECGSVSDCSRTADERNSVLESWGKSVTHGNDD